MVVIVSFPRLSSAGVLELVRFTKRRSGLEYYKSGYISASSAAAIAAFTACELIPGNVYFFSLRVGSVPVCDPSYDSALPLPPEEE